jgi:hypothetical protein
MSRRRHREACVSFRFKLSAGHLFVMLDPTPRPHHTGELYSVASLHMLHLRLLRPDKWDAGFAVCLEAPSLCFTHSEVIATIISEPVHNVTWGVGSTSIRRPACLGCHLASRAPRLSRLQSSLLVMPGLSLGVTRSIRHLTAPRRAAGAAQGIRHAVQPL